MGDLHLVLPAMNVSTLDAGILIMVQQVRLMMISLNMMDNSMSFSLLSGGAIDNILLFNIRLVKHIVALNILVEWVNQKP